MTYGFEFLERKPKWDDFWQYFALLIIATIIFAIILGFILSAAKAEEITSISMDKLDYETQQKIKDQNFWDDLVSIIIQIESSGNPYAVSEDGCIGLMQISRAVYKEYETNNPQFDHSNYDFVLFNPDHNKEIGTWYLHRIWEHYLPHYKLEQNIENLLIAYNFGIGNLIKYRQGKVKLPVETKNYWLKFQRLSTQR